MVEAETAYTLQSILLLGRLKRFADVTYYMISILVPLSGRDIPLVQCNGYLLISIRAPLTGRDLGATFFEEVASSISIHTPLSGRDRLCADVRGEFGISIHAPLTGSDVLIPILTVIFVISIHAPLTGSDFNNATGLFDKVDFNPRSPHRERLTRKPCRTKYMLFQSTLPSQGATPLTAPTTSPIDISIHAPLTGSDPELCVAERTPNIFQSTLPSQGATQTILLSLRVHTFQSTLPSQGATKALAGVGVRDEISIHAPLTGSDSTAPTQTLHHKISIHAPLTGSDSSASASLPVAYIFQSTLPSQGATLRGGGILHRGKYFNPRSPHRERQHFHFMRSVIKAISIHAPLTGSDDRTRKLPNAPPHISIHAPLTGSDDTWIATTHKAINFNPRSPHRERRTMRTRQAA